MNVSVGYNGFMGGPRSMGRVGYELLTYLLRHPHYEAYFLPYKNDYFEDQWNDLIRSRIPSSPDLILDKVVHFCSVIEAGRHPRARESIAWLFYELTSLPAQQVQEINTNELVLATSSFVKSVFLESGVTAPVRVMGHGYDPSVYSYQRRGPDDEFRFLCVAEHTPRKNLPLLLDCFAKAFDGNKAVRLILKLATHGEKDIRDYIRHPDCVRLITDDIITEAELVALYHRAHCFVLPTRGEGFGMPMLEAMATGLPVLVTGYGGHLDFCNETNAYLIQNRGFVDSDPTCFPFIQSQWADPDPDHLIHLMRDVYGNYGAALGKAEKAYDTVKDAWTWDAQFARELPPQAGP